MLTKFNFKSWMNKFNGGNRRSAKALRPNPTQRLTESLEERLLLTVGDLDPTFGNSGLQVTDFTDLTGQGEKTEAVEVAADGKIVSGGVQELFIGQVGFVARHNADGTLDSSFGDGGRVSIGAFGIRGISDLTVLADNSILVTGPVFNASQDFGVMKLMPNGDIDTSFGNRGLATIDFGPGNADTPRSIVQNGTKIIVAGDTNIAGNVDFAVVELDASGNQTAFATRMVKFDVGGGNRDIAYDVQVDASGRVLLAGSTEVTAGVFDFALARLTATGTPDTTFGGGKVQVDFGTTATPTNDEAFSVAIDTDGTIYPTGVTGPTGAGTTDFALAKLSNLGVLQTGFDTDGKKVQDFGAPGSTASNDRIAEVKIQAGNLVVAGQSRDTVAFNPQVDFAVGAFDKNTGALVPTFNTATGGRIHTTFFGYAQDAGNALDIDGSGNWVVAGNVGLQTDALSPTLAGTLGVNTNIALARYKSTDGTLDTAFGNGGRVVADTTETSGFGDMATAVEVVAGGKIVAGGATNSPLTGTSVGSVARYNADGTFDSSFGFGGRVTIGLFTTGITDLTVLPDNSILVTGPVLNASQDFGVMKLMPNGDIDTSFGNRGLATIDFGPGNADTPRSIVQNGTKIIVAGDTNIAGNVDFAVVELDASGNQTAFATRMVKFDVGGGNRDIAYDVQVDASGRVLLAGSTEVTAGVFDFALARLTATGTPDTTFGGGKVQVDFGTTATPTNDEAFSVAIDTDGTIYPTGVTGPTGAGTTDFALAKLSNLGVLQTGFDTDGKKVQDFGAPGSTASNDRIAEVKIQAGNLVVAGTSIETVGFNPRVDVAAGAFNKLTGALIAAPNPATGGRVHTSFFANNQDAGHALAIDANGNWVIAGATGLLTDTSAPVPGGFVESTNYGLARIKSTDGQLDSTFGNTGRVTTDFTNLSGTYDQSSGVEVQADGKVVVAGGTIGFVFGGGGVTNEGVVARYNSDGSLDQSFGIDGRVSVGVFSTAPFGVSNRGTFQFGITDLTVLADNSVLVTGPVNNASQDFGVLKLTPSGDIDTTFGNRGLATIDFGPGNVDTPRSIVQNGTKIVVAGDTNIAGNVDFAVVELDASGNQTAFGTRTVKFDLGGGNSDVAYDVKVDASGRILLAGSTESATAGVFDFGLARLTATGTLDTTFAGGMVNVNFGTTAAPATATNDEATSVVIGADGSIYAAGFTAPTGATGADFALAKLSDLGVLQTGFDTDGKVVQDFAPGGAASNDFIGEVALQDGKIVVGGGSSETTGPNPFSGFATGQFEQGSGALDPAINAATGGRNHTNFLTYSFAETTGLAIQPDGRWVQTGAASDFGAATGSGIGSASFGNFALARFDGPNAAPVIGGLAAVTYTENDAAKNIAAAATVTDADGDSIQSMTISLTNAVAADGASISITPSAGITLDAASTTTNLILTGSATTTAANFQTVLQTLQYTNPSENPTAAPPRTVTVVAQDSKGASSAVQTITITVVPVADLPVVDLNGGTAADGIDATVSYNLVTGGAQSVADATATVTDLDDMIQSATVTISAGAQTGDILAVTDSGGVTSALAGNVLTLTGAAAPAVYQTILRTLMFTATSTNTTARAFTVVATDAGGNASAPATIAVNVGGGVAPIVDLNGGTAADGINSTATYSLTTGGAQLVADVTATVTDADAGDMIQGATVTISAGAQTGDVLAVTDSGGVTSALAGNVLTLTGAATPAVYQTILRTLMFTATSTDTTARTLTVVATDALGNASTAANIVVSISAGPSIASADLDGSGGAPDQFTDGILMLAYLGGLQSAAQIRPLLPAGSTLADAQVIVDRLQGLTSGTSATFDVDQSGGAVDLFTDGILMLAYFSGLRTAAQLAPLVVTPPATVDAAAIKTNMDALFAVPGSTQSTDTSTVSSLPVTAAVTSDSVGHVDDTPVELVHQGASVSVSSAVSDPDDSSQVETLLEALSLDNLPGQPNATAENDSYFSSLQGEDELLLFN